MIHTNVSCLNNSCVSPSKANHWWMCSRGGRSEAGVYLSADNAAPGAPLPTPNVPAPTALE